MNHSVWPSSLSSGSFTLSVVCALVTGGCDGYAALNAPACEPSMEYGAKVGDRVQNFGLQNQQGRKTHLGDFCGDVVVVQMGAMWCPICQGEAAKIKGLTQKYGNDGLTILNLMTETPDGDDPASDDLEDWAKYFKISSPVLADNGWKIWERYFDVHATPRTLLIDRKGRILSLTDVITEEEIQAALQ